MKIYIFEMTSKMMLTNIKYSLDIESPRTIPTDPHSIDKELKKINKLREIENFDETIKVLKHYILNFIPSPRQYENYLWMVSCYPSYNFEFRINIYWQEVFSLNYDQLMIFSDSRVLTDSHFKRLKKLYKSLINEGYKYKKGLETQQMILLDFDDYFNIMKETVFYDSVKLYNRELMEKGKIVHTGHNYFLASYILEENNEGIT